MKTMFTNLPAAVLESVVVVYSLERVKVLSGAKGRQVHFQRYTNCNISRSIRQVAVAMTVIIVIAFIVAVRSSCGSCCSSARSCSSNMCY